MNQEIIKKLLSIPIETRKILTSLLNIRYEELKNELVTSNEQVFKYTQGATLEIQNMIKYVKNPEEWVFAEEERQRIEEFWNKNDINIL